MKGTLRIQVLAAADGALKQLKAISAELRRIQTLSGRAGRTNFGFGGFGTMGGGGGGLRTQSMLIEEISMRSKKASASMGEFTTAGVRASSVGNTLSGIATQARVADAEIDELTVSMRRMQMTSASGIGGGGFIPPTSGGAAAVPVSGGSSGSKAISSTLKAIPGLAVAGAAAISGMGNALVGVGKEAQWLGRIFEYRLTLPIMALAGVGLKWAFDTDAALTRLRKVYDGATKDIGRLSKAARLLSDIYGIQQDRVVGLMATWAEAGAVGLPLARMAELTIQSSILSGNDDLESSARDLITVSRAYNLASTEMQQALAVINLTENITAASTSDLITVFAKTGASANLYGVELHELAAMTAALVPAAANASEAGNSLKTLFSRLMAPTTAAKNAMRAAGLEIDGAAWASSSATDRIKELAAATRELSDNEQAQLLSDVAGRRQVNRLAALLDDINDANGQFNKVINRTADPSEALSVFDQELLTQMESDSQQFKRLTNIMKNSLIEAVQPLMPLIINFLNQLAGLSRAFSQLDPSTKKLIGTIVGLAAIIGPIISMLGLFAIALGGLIKAVVAPIAMIAALAARFGFLIAWLARAWVAVKAFAVGLLAVGGSVKAFLAVVAGITALPIAVVNAMAIIVGGIAALLLALATGNQRVRDLVGNIGRTIAGGFSRIMAALPAPVYAAMSAVVRIVASAARAVYRALSWMNPFARHSPSLVEQVRDGTAVIASDYDTLAGNISGSVGQIENSTRALSASLADARSQSDALKYQEALEDAGATGASTAHLGQLYNLVKAAKPELEGMEGAIAAQERTVESWQDSIDDINRTIDIHNDKLEEARRVVEALDEQIADAESRLSDWLSTPVIGTYAFEDALFANQQQADSYRLEMLRLEQQVRAYGFTVDDVRRVMDEQGDTASNVESRMASLATEIDRLRGEEMDLRLLGAGSDVLGGIMGDIGMIDTERRRLAEDLGSSDAGGLTIDSPEFDELSKLVSQIDSLGESLTDLELERDVLNLEESLQLGPARKAIEDTQRVNEASVQQILAGIAAEQAALDSLIPQRQQAQAAVEAQEEAIRQLESVRDSMQTSMEIEQDILQSLQGEYDDLAEAIRNAEAEMESISSLAGDLEGAEIGGGDVGGGLGVPGDFGGGGAGGGFDELWSDEEFDSWLEDLFEQAYGDLPNPFERIKEWWDETKDWLSDSWTSFWPTINLDGFGDSIDRFFQETAVGRWLDEYIVQPFDNAIETVKQAWGPLWAELEEWFDLFVDFMDQKINELLTLIDLIVDQAKLKLAEWEPLWSFVGAVVGHAIEAIGGFIGGVITIVTGILQILRGLMTGDWSLIWEGAQNIVKGFEGAMAAAKNFVLNVFRELWAGVKNAWESQGRPAIQGVMNFVDRLETAVRNAGGVMSRAFDSIGPGLGGALRRAKGYVTGPINSIIGAVNSFLDRINSVLSTLGSGFRVPRIGGISSGSGGGGSSNFREKGGTVPVSSVGSGFITDGIRAIVGEGRRAFEEYVIPTDPRYRNNALKLMSQAAGRLGMGQTPQYASGGVIGGVPGYATGGVLDSFLNPVKAAYNRAKEALLSRIPGGSGIGAQIAQTGVRYLLEKVATKITSLFSNASKRYGTVDKASYIARNSPTTYGSARVGNSIFRAQGGTIPTIPAAANGAYVKRSRGGTLLNVGEGRFDEMIRPVPRGGGRFTDESGEGDTTIILEGDLSFPNFDNGSDIEDFVDELKSLTGVG